MHSTPQDLDVGRQADARADSATEEIKITPEMIEAGVTELREKTYGQPLATTVEDVFWAMMSLRIVPPPPQ